jgi:hypothetical protein
MSTFQCLADDLNGDVDLLGQRLPLDADDLKVRLVDR